MSGTEDREELLQEELPEEKGRFEGRKNEPSGMTDALLEAEMVATHLELEDLRMRYHSIARLLFRKMKPKRIRALLREENDWRQWFSFLSHVASKYLVVLTVKDTPGNDMPNYALRCIREAGFDQFRTDLWRTYVGVIHRGKVMFQGFHENEERTDYHHESMETSFSITATSQAWRQGNAGDIHIVGRQCSVNLRGVNIVVYDVERRELVDSIGFDSHEAGNISFLHWDGLDRFANEKG